MNTRTSKPKAHLIAAALAVMTFAAWPVGENATTGTTGSQSTEPAELVTVSGQPKAALPAMPRPMRGDLPTSGPARGWRGRQGWQGGGRQITNLAQWHEVDGRFQEAARRFKENTARREEVMASLSQKKDRVKPGQVDPISVLERKEIDRQLGQMHTLIEVDRANTEETARILRGTLISKDRWIPTLGKLLDDSLAGSKLTNTDRERMKLWRDGIATLKSDDTHGFITKVLGTDYGEYIIESVPTIVRRPGPGNGPPPGMGPGDMRRNMIGRLSQLEHQQAVLRQDLERQDQEIARLRQMLQTDDRDRKPAIPTGKTEPSKEKPSLSNE